MHYLCSMESAKETHKVYLGIGSNLGEKEANIDTAIEKIDRQVGKIIARSSFYYSKPMGFESVNDFVNAVVLCRTSLTPHEVLSMTQGIEREMGRTHKSSFNKETSTFDYKDRIIDIDILLYDDLQVNDTDLQIPHPRMEERDFVTVPLAEIVRLIP